MEVPATGWTTTSAVLAAYGGRADALRVLIHDVDKASNGETPALMAAQEGHVDALRQAKADVDKPNGDGVAGVTPALRRLEGAPRRCRC